MSVYVTDFSITPWTVVHDDAPGGAHEGTVDPTTILHTTNMDGTPNDLFIVVECPVCGATSTHPVGGGAQPPLVQEMFIRVAMRDGCCGGTLTKAAPVQAAHDHVKEHTEAMDGEGRWQVTPEQLAGI